MERICRSIGARIHDERQRRGLSQRQLAAKADLSASMLGMIEKGTTNPSVASLFAIAGALGLPLSDFFNDQAGGARPVGALAADEADAGEGVGTPDLEVGAAGPAGRGPKVAVHERATLQLTGGITWSRLTPGPEPGMEFIEICYEGGACSGERAFTHPGREWGMVLEGELIVQLGFEEHCLGPGDTIVFDSTTPHRLCNQGKTPVRAIWVNFTPS